MTTTDILNRAAAQFWRTTAGPCLHPDPAIRRAVDAAEKPDTNTKDTRQHA